MKIYVSLLLLLMAAASLSLAQNINPARLLEKAKGHKASFEGGVPFVDRNGNLLREENYHNYRLDGEMKIFYPAGALKELLHYIDGLRDGDDKAYFESGGLQ